MRSAVYMLLLFLSLFAAGCGGSEPRPEISEALQVSDDTIVLGESGEVIFTEKSK